MIAITPEDQEWYTPQHILDRVYAVIGQPDIDPCCNRYGPANVNAKDYCRLPERDGLAESWHGTVFLNPPYGREIGKWIDKACSEWACDNLNTMISLVPAKTDTQWWEALTGYATCWCAVRGRMKFVKPDGTIRGSGTFASAIVLWSYDLRINAKFRHEFYSVGPIWGQAVGWV